MPPLTGLRIKWDGGAINMKPLRGSNTARITYSGYRRDY